MDLGVTLFQLFIMWWPASHKHKHICTCCYTKVILHWFPSFYLLIIDQLCSVDHLYRYSYCITETHFYFSLNHDAYFQLSSNQQQKVAQQFFVNWNYHIVLLSSVSTRDSETCIRISYSRPTAAKGRLWPNIAPKIRYQVRGFRGPRQVRVQSVISFHCRNICAFAAVGWGLYVADTVAHLSAATEGGMCSFTGS